MRDRFGIFGTVIRIRKLSLLLVMMLRIPNIYYVSGALSGAKLNYMKIEKIAYVVLIASRKLKHYFQRHEIKVPTSQPG